jgi:hypothetical protein
MSAFKVPDALVPAVSGVTLAALTFVAIYGAVEFGAAAREIFIENHVDHTPIGCQKGVIWTRPFTP